MLIFNNGDPIMFNSAAKAILDGFSILRQRGDVANPDTIDTHLSLVRAPVDIVSSLQRDFCREGRRRVGGRPHDLAITPGGIYHSRTGDDQ